MAYSRGKELLNTPQKPTGLEVPDLTAVIKAVASVEQINKSLAELNVKGAVLEKELEKAELYIMSLNESLDSLQTRILQLLEKKLTEEE